MIANLRHTETRLVLPNIIKPVRAQLNRALASTADSLSYSGIEPSARSRTWVRRSWPGWPDWRSAPMEVRETMFCVETEPDPIPAQQRRSPGGSIRWAVDSPEGPRSQSWLLKGRRSDDDVYLGPRWDTGVIKLSLHRSGRWRMAWTDEYADSVGLPAGADRVLGRWDPPRTSGPAGSTR